MDKSSKGIPFTPVSVLRVFDILNIPAALTTSDELIVWSSLPFSQKKIHTIIAGKTRKSDDSASADESIYYYRDNGKKYIIQEFATENSKFYLIIEHITHVSSDEDKKAQKKLVHDLSNILTNTINSAELLKRKTRDNREIEPNIKNIIHNSERASEMIEALLRQEYDFDKNKVALDSLKLIKGFVNSVKASTPPGIRIFFDHEKELGSIIGNPSDIFRALINIYNNAVEAIGAEGSINITASVKKMKFDNGDLSRDSQYLVIEIEDDGAGIEPANLDKIFELNFSTKNKERESGFGLAIVKEIIEDHNGKIRVASEIGKGSKFVLYFPSELEKERKEVNGHGRKILVAEDEIPLLDSLAELFESYNFRVVKAVNGYDILEKFNDIKDIDLLIIDKRMPILDGIDCVKEIRKTDKHIPIIIASGSRGEDPNDLEELYVNKFLKKPYNFDQLIDAVEELLEKSL